MNSSFLKEVLGNNGYQAMKKASDKYPILKPIIVPRVILSWVQTVGNIGYEGAVPGKEDSYFSLKKSEDVNGYSGALTIDDDLYTFDKADILHVCASLGVTLGIDLDFPNQDLQKKDLSKLGKDIDVLVKSQFVRSHKDNYRLTLKISRDLAKKECHDCGGRYFQNDKCTLCFCLSDLAKSIKTDLLDDGYLIKFDKSIDDEALDTIVSLFK